MTTLSPAVLSILELFKGPLSSVRFADVDAEGLAALAADVERAALAVADQEAKLAELRQGLAARQEALLVLAQRALAYARVYAENNDELLEELNGISLPRVAKARKPNAMKSTSAVSASSVVEASVEASAEESEQTEPVVPVETRQVEVEAQAEPSEPVEVTPAPSGRKARKHGAFSRDRQSASGATDATDATDATLEPGGH